MQFSADCQPLTMESNLKKKAEGGGASSSFEITEYIDPVETLVKVALLEQSIGHINQTLIRIEKRLDKIDDQFNEFRRDVKSDFRWMIGLMIGFGSGLSAVMAHGFHWF